MVKSDQSRSIYMHIPPHSRSGMAGVIVLEIDWLLSANKVSETFYNLCVTFLIYVKEE